VIKHFNKINKVSGVLILPGDKSISHRAVMFAALAEGKSIIENCLLSEDVLSTINCFKQLGVRIEIKGTTVAVYGKGFGGLRKSEQPLFAGNSGTTARLLSGILAMQKFKSEINGDVSLSKRPMERIITPLKLMGADIKSSPDNTLPLKFYPSQKLQTIEYDLPIASAQVKSAILLAGIFLKNRTKVIEPVPTRNHTENLLYLTVETRNNVKIISVSRENYPIARDYFVPSDISTASFFIVLTLLSTNSEIVLKNISLNETRSGIISILKKMGGAIKLENIREICSEKYGDVLVRSSILNNIQIDKKIIPNIIDEIPILAIAGYFAKGVFSISNAEELRNKESDRITAICENFKKLGAEVKEYTDGFSIRKKLINNNMVFSSYKDHRIAMSFAILSLLLRNGGTVNGFECVNISNPQFMEQVTSIISEQ